MSLPALSSRTRVTRIAQEAMDRARLSVVPRARTRAPRVPFVSLVSLVLVGGVVGLLLFNTSMQQASFTASALESQAEVLTGREQTLRMDLGQLRNPQRVAMQAQEMGMGLPPAPVFLDLGTGAASDVPVPARREDAIPLLPDAPIKPAVLAPRPTVVTAPPTTPEPTTPDAAKSGSKNKAGKKAGNKTANKTGSR